MANNSADKRPLTETPTVLPLPDFHFPGEIGRTYLESDPAHLRIGIRHARDQPTNSRRSQRIRARRRAPLMRVRLQIDVKSSAASLAARRFQRENFRVLDAFKSVRAFTDYLAFAIHNHGPHTGIGRS